MTSAGQPRAPFDTQVAPAMSPAGKPAGVEEPTKDIPIDVSLPPLPPSKP
jgi:hypothetical protein